MEQINMANNDQQIQKNVENPEKLLPRNILTNFQETVDVIAQLEGEQWKSEQNREGKTVMTAVKTLRDLRPDASRPKNEHIFTISGIDKWHRYFVYPDGRVTFNSLHQFEKSEERDVARSLGFDVE
jgi:hypothetical protein